MKNIPLYEVREIRDLKDMINSSIKLFKDKPAFWVKEKGSPEYKPVTYGQVKIEMDALGTALFDLGLNGKRIAIIGENRYEWALTYLTVVSGTGLVVPIDKELPENEIISLMKRAQIDAVIYSGNISSKMSTFISDENNSHINFICMDKPESGKVLYLRDLIETGKKLLETGKKDYLEAQIDPEEMNIMLFTSATTDTSKVVMLSQKNICVNLMSMCKMIDIRSEDIFFSLLPLHHTYECTCGFLCPFYRGSSIAYCEGLRHIAKNLQESKATIFLGVPLIFETMYKKIWDSAKKSGSDKKLKTGIKICNFMKTFKVDLTKKLFAPIYESFGGNLRLMISGAAGINPSVAKGYRDFGLGFLQGYGLTECSPIVALNRDVDFKDSAAGLAMPGVEVKINEPGEDGIGEIICKGENVMLGYYNDEVNTAKVIKDGWFYTGDLGYMDSDGFVYITGRKKHVIVTKNGKNIYPEEIETLINEISYVKESIVYGKEDEKSGEMIVAALIVPDMEKLESEGKTIKDVEKMLEEDIKVINKKLVLYKYIRDYTIREQEFAKTTTKKIKRYMEKVD